MAIRQINISTTGSAGSATGSGTCEKFRGVIEAVHVAFDGSAPATTDTTITLDGAFTQTITTLTNINTSTTLYPSHELTDATGSGRTSFAKYFADWQSITVSVAGSDAITDAVTVYISFSDYGGR